jgi:hypothetical protein
VLVSELTQALGGGLHHAVGHQLLRPGVGDVVEAEALDEQSRPEGGAGEDGHRQRRAVHDHEDAREQGSDEDADPLRRARHGVGGRELLGGLRQLRQDRVVHRAGERRRAAEDDRRDVDDDRWCEPECEAGGQVRGGLDQVADPQRPVAGRSVAQHGTERRHERGGDQLRDHHEPRRRGPAPLVRVERHGDPDAVLGGDIEQVRRDDTPKRRVARGDGVHAGGPGDPAHRASRSTATCHPDTRTGAPEGPRRCCVCGSVP